jgi:carboxymethylenebutenolidase
MVTRIPIKSFDGHVLDGHLHHAASVRAPGVVMIPEIYGITQSLSETAARFAGEGYTVLVLDIFSRLKRGVVLGYDEPGHKQGRAYHDAFEYAQGVKDMQAAISVLRARPECNGRVGVVGFCLGGTMAYLAAARTDADAAAGYYGTRIHNFLDEAKGIQRPLVLHFGERDHTTPPEVLARILSAISGNSCIQPYVYPNAIHAFANHARPNHYSAAATALADQRTFSLFHSRLSSSQRTISATA